MRLSGWKSIVAFLSLALFCAACSPEQNNPNGSKTGGDDSHSDAPAVTVGVDKLSAISVVLKGKANLPASVAADLKIGFQYSKSAGILPTNSTTVDAEDADADYNYTTGITGLDPETTYYFRSFVRQNGQDTYGETKSFTTPLLLKTFDADNISETKACINAKLDLTNVQYKSLEYGFYWGTSESEQNTYVKCSNLSESIFSHQLSGLMPNKQYWFKSCVIVDSYTYMSEVKLFATNDIDATVETLDATDVGGKKATLNGKLTVNSTEILEINVWFLYSDKETTLEGLKNSGKTASSTFSNENAFIAFLSGLTLNATYSYLSVAKVGGKTLYGDLKQFTTHPDYPEAIDMGLSVKWSSWNLGASSPEDYGEYYAWGELEPKTKYNWSTYKWCKNGSADTMNKYTTQTGFETKDNKTVLDLEDDVAHVILGGNWRMPTIDEWHYLHLNCFLKWTEQNGVMGILVTARNGNSIFLPAAGYRDGTTLYGVGGGSCYWSSSILYEDPKWAKYVYFNTDSDHIYGSDAYRYVGLQVRPVSE